MTRAARAGRLRGQADDGLRDRAEVRDLAARRRELQVDRQRVLDAAGGGRVAAGAVEVDAAGEGELPAVAGEGREAVGLPASAVARQPLDDARRGVDLAQVLAADVDDAALRPGARLGGSGGGRDRGEGDDGREQRRRAHAQRVTPMPGTEPAGTSPKSGSPRRSTSGPAGL